jgi:hypothetical protein
MRIRRGFTVIPAILLAAVACNFSPANVSTLSQPENPTLSAQTAAAMQGKPLSTGTAGPGITQGAANPPTASAAVSTPTVAALTGAMLRNWTYKLPLYKETVTLVDGKYDRAESNENLLHVAIVEPITFGDLNGDGAADAAVLLSENGGGTGFFVSVIVMLNQGGVPVQSASRLIDDRPQINGMTILGGRIAVDAVIHGVQDPMCCPDFPVVETMQLWHGGLSLVRFTSSAGGQERAITIASPRPMTVVSGSVPVVGNVTISPFENTLGYEIYGAEGDKLGNGSIMVTSGGMGTAGTFTAYIDISAIPSGTDIQLELLDLSMADGSILAMDSVFLAVQ